MSLYKVAITLETLVSGEPDRYQYGRGMIDVVVTYGWAVSK